MQTLLPADELVALNLAFEEAHPRTILEWALVDAGFERIALASAFQAEGTIAMHLATRIRPDVPVLFLETGYQFAETLAFKERLTELLGLNVVDLVGEYTVERQAELMRFFEEEDARLRGDLRELDEEQRALKESLAKLQAELDQLRSARPRQRHEVRLEVEALSAGNFETEITYVVGRAGWRPLYDVRLREAGGAGGPVVALTSLAEITQNTGQDWGGVRLSVSTARPALNQRAPELKPWFVDAFQPQPRMAKGFAMQAARADVMEAAAG